MNSLILRPTVLINSTRNQTGAVTIVMSTIVLFLLSMVSVFAARVMITDHRISSNYYYSKQSYTSAQAGMEEATLHLDRRNITVHASNTYDIFTNTTDTSCPGIDAGDTGKMCLKDDKNNADASDDIGLGIYRAKYSAPVDADTVYISVNAWAPDGTGSKQFTQAVRFAKAMSYPPPAPLVASGNIGATTTASVTLRNMNSDVAFWIGGNNNGSPTSTVSSGSGEYASQAALSAIGSAGDMFDNFFSYDSATIQRHAEIISCGGGCTSSSNAIDPMKNTGGIFWVEGNITLNASTILGTTTDPAIIIMNGGQLILSNNNSTVNGVIFQFGDWLDGGSDGLINGALIVQGDFSESGSLTIDYGDAGAAGIPEITNLGQLGIYNLIAGSWKDF